MRIKKTAILLLVFFCFFTTSCKRQKEIVFHTHEATTEVEESTTEVDESTTEKETDVEEAAAETSPLEVTEEDSQLEVYNSNLPVIYINTENSEAITSKEDYVYADAVIQGNANYSDQYSGKIKIKGRGNSSWKLFPKKGYKIKLEEGTDLFGLGKSKNWVLLADYLDESLMRTRFCTGLADSLDLLNMDGEWVVLILNGEYLGIYELTEQVRIESGRVDIFDWEDEAEDIAEAIARADGSSLTEEDEDALTDAMTENLTWMTSGVVEYNDKTYNVSDYYTVEGGLQGGYLFELSEEYDEPSEFLTSPSEYCVMFKSPEYAATNEAVMNYAKYLWNEWDEAIHSETGYSADGVYYTDICDLQSMVDYWLLNEFIANGDAVKKSRFAYIGEDGKITFGPVWDFDFSLNTTSQTLEKLGWVSEIGALDDAEGWKICTSDNTQNFFNALITHADFLELAYARYNEILKPAIEANLETLDTYYAYLHEEALKNTSKWQFDRGFEADYLELKNYIQERYEWMNGVFETKEGFLGSLS